MKNRKIYRLILLSVFLLFFSTCAASAKNQYVVINKQIDSIKAVFGKSFGPVITYPDKNLESLSVFYYTLKPSKDKLIYTFQKTNLTLEDTKESYNHNFLISNTGAGFDYRIVSADDAINGKMGRILIPRQTPYQFAVYGDTRTRYDDHLLVCEAIAGFKPDFVINTGDLVESGSDINQWPLFFQSASPILGNAPYLPAQGNHDDHTALWKYFFNLPENGEFYYSYELPRAKVIILDSEADFSPISAQYRWLTNELISARNEWKIVVFHNPPYSSSVHRTDPGIKALQETLVPVLEQYRVNLVLNGHDHLYERYEKNNVTYITTGGGGAPFYAEEAKNPYRLKLITKEFHFVIITIDENSIKGSVYNEKKRLLDNFDIVE